MDNEIGSTEWLLEQQRLRNDKRQKEQDEKRLRESIKAELLAEQTDTEESEQFSELDDLKLENEKQKSEILDKIADRLDEEDKQEKQTDDLVKFIKSDPIVEELVRNYCSLLLSFSKLGEDKKPMVDRVEIVIQRSKDEKIVKVTPRLLDKNGNDIGFDEKGVMIRQGDND